MGFGNRTASCVAKLSLGVLFPESRCGLSPYRLCRRKRRIHVCMIAPVAMCIALLASVRTGRAAAQSPGEKSFQGKKVVRIELHTDANLNLQEFQQQITQKSDAPLDLSKVNESLKKLYATSRFETLRAEAEPAPGGIDLIFAGEARYFVGVVRVSESPRAIPPETLAAGARLTLGEPLSQAVLAEARKRILSVLATNAYYRAQVSCKVIRHKQTQAAEVVFTITPGAPAGLGKVQFEGMTLVQPQRLINAAGWKKDARLTSGKIQRGLYRIRTFLAKRNYLEATVSTKRREYNAHRNTETLVVRINPGPVVRVRTEGAHISTSQLKKILPVYTDGLTDDLSLDSGSDAIADYYEKKGYFSVHVRWNRIQHEHPDETDITYIIDPGERSTFGGYAFKGNFSISSADLSGVVTLEPASFPTRLHGVFSQQMLDHDVNAIKSLYRSKGFLAAKVNPVQSSQQGDLFVRFNIDEGPITRVGSVTIEGVDSPLAAKLKAVLKAGPGQPYSPDLATKDRNAMLNALANEGFNQAAISMQVIKAAGHKMDLRYNVEPGPLESVRNVVVLGNAFTREGVIRRQLTLKAGQPLDQSKLLQSQSNLYNLGLFNSVQIAPENPAGAALDKTMLVRVEEAPRWTLGYGFGVDVQRLGGGQPQGSLGVSPRLSLDATRINVGGRNQTFSARTRVSDLETGGELSYLIPNFLNHPDLTFHIDGIAYRTRDILTFTSMISQGSLSIQKQFTPFTYWVNRYNYRLVSVSNLKIDELQIPLFNQPVRDAGFESTLIHDTRDDPANATRGSYSLIDGSVSSTKLGSEASFSRIFGQYATYYRLGSHFVFARDTQLGLEAPFGALKVISIPGETPQIIRTNTIPLAERFFAGGSDSLRAFSLNQAGPRDPVTGYPLGGQAFFLNSLEMRIPIRNGRYGLVFFNDLGNVYSSLSEMRLLKFTQTSPTDLNYTVGAFGIGLRYRTPIGPVRLDFSYVPNAPRYKFQPNPSLPPEVQRLPQFQYFISIGQSF